MFALSTQLLSRCLPALGDLTRLLHCASNSSNGNPDMSGRDQRGEGRGGDNAIQARRLKLVKSVIAKAMKVKDPLASLPDTLRNLQIEGNVFSASASNAAISSPETLEWCLGLCRSNMQALYQQAAWGWKDDEKRAELSSGNTTLLIAHDRSTPKTPVAYVSYRFECEDEAPVLYVYELQVSEASQKRGLGSWLMAVTEWVAWQHGMHKIVLTVLHENMAGVQLYSKLGYSLYDTSPTAQEAKEDPSMAGYNILCKSAPARKYL